MEVNEKRKINRHIDKICQVCQKIVSGRNWAVHVTKRHRGENPGFDLAATKIPPFPLPAQPSDDIGEPRPVEEVKEHEAIQPFRDAGVPDIHRRGSIHHCRQKYPGKCRHHGCRRPCRGRTCWRHSEATKEKTRNKVSAWRMKKRSQSKTTTQTAEIVHQEILPSRLPKKRHHAEPASEETKSPQRRAPEEQQRKRKKHNEIQQLANQASVRDMRAIFNAQTEKYLNPKWRLKRVERKKKLAAEVKLLKAAETNAGKLVEIKQKEITQLKLKQKEIRKEIKSTEMRKKLDEEHKRDKHELKINQEVGRMNRQMDRLLKDSFLPDDINFDELEGRRPKREQQAWPRWASGPRHQLFDKDGDRIVTFPKGSKEATKQFLEIWKETHREASAFVNFPGVRLGVNY